MRAPSNRRRGRARSLGHSRRRHRQAARHAYSRRLRVEPLEDRRLLTGYTVDSLADTVAADGEVTLREAIEAANADSPFHDAPAGSGADTIAFDPDLFAEGPQTLWMAGVEFEITDDLTITGPGKDVLTVNGGGLSRIFRVDDGTGAKIDVALVGMTIKRGYLKNGFGGAIYSKENLVIQDAVLWKNEVDSYPGISNGGAIYNDYGKLEMIRSTIGRTYCADEGGAIFNEYGEVILIDSVLDKNVSGGWFGGAILSHQGKGVTVIRSTFTNNEIKYGNGGGIAMGGGNLAVIDSVFSHNTAYTAGGGIHVAGNLTISGSTISENTARSRGAGIEIYGTATITDSHITGNIGFKGCGIKLASGATLDLTDSVVSGNGGNALGAGIYNEEGTLRITGCVISNNIAEFPHPSVGRDGGGIYNKGRLEIVNSTISGNAAVKGQGGGIYIDPDTTESTTIHNSTIVNNSADVGGGLRVSVGTLTAHNTIIADNSAVTLAPDVSGWLDGSYNLIEDTTGSFLLSSKDILGQDPVLGPLTDNGGPTQTHLPQPGSPAIEGGDPSYDPYVLDLPAWTDQRGYKRVADADGDGLLRIDIGACEVEIPPVAEDDAYSIVENTTLVVGTLQGLFARAGFNDDEGIHSDLTPDSPYQLGGPIAGLGDGEPGWNGRWTLGTGEVQDSVVFEGDLAARLDPVSSYARTLNAAQTESFVVEQYVRFEAGAQTVVYHEQSDPGSEMYQGPIWQAMPDGKFYVVDGIGDGSMIGAEVDTGFSWVPGRWYRVRVEVDVAAQTWEFSVDGQKYAAPDALGFRGTPASLDQVRYLSEGSAFVYLDYLSVFSPAEPWEAGVAANDTDFDNDPLVVSLVTRPLYGTLTLAPDGSFAYAPEAGFVGADTFSYLVNDGRFDSNVATVTITVEPGPEPGPVPFCFSLETDGTVDGLDAADEDIVEFDGSAFQLYFDGSDVGLEESAVDAVALLAGREILMSFTATAVVPGIADTVEACDLVKFTPTQLGETTAGAFELYFDGSDVGLDVDGMNVDAVEMLEDGRMALSLGSDFDVGGIAGSDEDLLLFTPTSLGPDTAGTWAEHFDGSDVDLAEENVDAVTINPRGNLRLSTDGAFSVAGLAGDDEDVFLFRPTSSGPDTSGRYARRLYFDGSQYGLEANDLSAIDTVLNGAPVADGKKYDARVNGLLNVARAEGVLLNDSDPDGDPLKAVLVDAPSHGTLILGVDGSFAYTADVGFAGIDQFTYRAGDGRVDSNLATVTLQVMQIGPLAFLELDDLDPSAGDVVCHLTTTREGFLTLEAMFNAAAGDAQLTLYDDAFAELATSTFVGENQRIDYPVGAREVYSFMLTGTNGDVDLRLVNLVSHVGTEVTVYGTERADWFEFDPAASRLVTINGVEYHFEDAGFTSATFDGGNGDDVALLYGDPDGPNQFETWPGEAEFSGDDFMVRVTSIRYVHAYANQGPTDVALLHGDPDGPNRFEAWPRRAKLRGDDHFACANSFRYVHTYAGQGPVDVALLHGDPNGPNQFEAWPDEAKLSGDDYFARAKSFPYVHAYGHQGPADVAFLYGDPNGPNRFEAWPDESKLRGDDYFARAKAFRYVHTYAYRSGDDHAVLHDSALTDYLRGYRYWVKLYDAAYSFFYRASGYDSVKAYSTTPSGDIKRVTAIDYVLDLSEYYWQDS